MARFFVGQRVRLVSRPGGPSVAGFVPVPIGTQGVILGFKWVPRGSVGLSGQPFREDCDVVVAWDSYGRRHVHTGRIEPIAYGGAQPARWEDCAWRPDGSHKTEKVAEEGRALALRALYG